jgi:DNA-binding MarR family transcriptional regulator
VLPLAYQETCDIDIARRLGVERQIVNSVRVRAVRDGLLEVTRSAPAVRHGSRDYFQLTEKGRRFLFLESFFPMRSRCSPT